MMKNVFKLALFSLVLNIAVGIMQVAVVDVNGNQVFGVQDRALVPAYNSNSTGVIVNAKDEAVNPAGVTEDKGNLVFRLLDLISLGLISRIITVIDTYLYGFVNFLDTLFGVYLQTSNSVLYALLFGTVYIPGLLKTLITVGYVLAVFELWTNKTLVD